jgi:hypothetical protein
MGTILIIVVLILLFGGGGGYYGYRRYGGPGPWRRFGFGVDHSFGALVLRRPAFQRSVIRAAAVVFGFSPRTRRCDLRQRLRIFTRQRIVDIHYWKNDTY